MKDKTEEMSYDFSSRGKGQVVALEDFLEDDPNEEGGNPPEDKEEDPIGSLIDEDSKVGEEGEDQLNLSGLSQKGEEEEGEEGEEEGEEGGEGSSLLEKSNILEDKVKSSNSNYKDIIKELVSENIWEGIDAFETEEGEVSFEDMEIDKDTFLTIFKENLEVQKAKLLENKVSTEGVSEFTQTLLEIEKNGGNVAQALESYNKYKNPIENLDLENEADQQSALYLMYQAKGIEEGEIYDLIDSFKSKGKLKEKAVDAKESLEVAFKKQLENINSQAITDQESRQENIKKYKKSLGEELKTYSFSDSYRKKLLEVAVKEDAEGGYELDKIYSSIRQDPKKAADLILFLTDKEEYLKQMNAASKRENDLKTLRKIKVIPKSKSNIRIDTGDKKRSKDKNLVSLESFS